MPEYIIGSCTLDRVACSVLGEHETFNLDRSYESGAVSFYPLSRSLHPTSSDHLKTFANAAYRHLSLVSAIVN